MSKDLVRGAHALGPLDIDVLYALLHGDAHAVDSSHRVRLEMLGLLTDSAQGLKLTPAGAEAALGSVTTKHEMVEEKPRLASGRQRPNRRLR